MRLGSGVSRRSVAAAGFGALGALAVRGRVGVSAQDATAPSGGFGYPIRWPDRIPGDGFFIRVAYACENTRYYPGWWHTGENWHALDGETAGAEVVAIVAGEVVFAGYDYPGPVVIVRHDGGLFSQYGHLDYALAVDPGESVERGQQLGTVLRRSDDPARSHLHAEVRTFFQRDDVNGMNPRYGVTCGFDCPPGPGYWPMDAPEHPSDLGYLNPTHAIARRAYGGGPVAEGAEVVVPAGTPEALDVWASVPDAAGIGAADSETLRVRPGDRFSLLDAAVGPAASTATGGEGYRLWYRVRAAGEFTGWVRAAVPSTEEVGGDGRGSAIRFALVPASGD